MKPEQMRIKIAEYLGWKLSNDSDFIIHPDGTKLRTHFDHWTEIVPDYPNDLNACAVFEATLTEYEDREYRDFLIEMTFCKEHRATPLQRCEAFLRTKILWEESK